MRSYLLVLSAAATLVACGDNLQGDQPPTVAGRAITTAEDTATTFTVDASDPENEGLTFTASTPAHGTITVAGASLTYTPDADYHGDDTVTVTVSDGAFSASAAVAITVTPVNDAPVADDDAVATSEDVPAVIVGTTLTANDTDVDGDSLSVTAVGTASAGTAVLAAGTVTYTPPLDFTGDATFTYTVSDGTASAMATVTVAVGGANDPPVATDDTVTTPEDTAATIPAATLLANDTDPEGQTLTVTAVAGATNGTVALAGTTITFTPTANFSGAATFTYTVSDGADTDTGTVTVTVTPVNDGPVAVADTATTAEDTVATIPAATLLANDSDVESTPTVTAVSGATNGTVALAGTTITFTPAANFNGAAGFDYTISDGTLTATARVTVTVTPVNDGPVAVADAVTTAEDTAAVIPAATLLTNDTDVDGPSLTITAVTGATGGTVALAGTTVTFTPTANTSGTGGFDYTISDGTLTSTARVTVTVTPVNDAPVAVADTVAATEDTVATITAATLLTNDTDADGTPTVTAVSNPTGGTVALAGTTITFTPTANFNGAGGFDYTISDGTLTATARVTVNVAPVNDGPVANADTVAATEDTIATITAATLLTNDTDVDSTPTVTAVSNPTNGTVVLAGTTITFAPTADFSGVAGFDYTISDGTLTSTAHVTVNVAAANDAPVATDDTVAATEDTDATITAAELLANDTDAESTPTVTAVGNPTNGTVLIAGTTITFTPAADFSGVAGFDYAISDGTLTATAHVTVNVAPVNDGPVAVADFASTNQDTPAIIPDATLLLNDTDVDGPALTVTAVSNPTNGTVLHVGTTVTFTPTAGFTGTAGFDYTISDGTLTSTAHVTVSVGNVNDAPVAVADAITTDEDTAAVISGATLTGNDTDPDSDPLFVSAVGGATNGTVSLVLGVITFTPTANFFGTAGFDYTVSDGFLTATAHVTVTVNSIDDLPVAVDDNAFTQEDLGVFVDVQNNDTGLGDGGVSVTATTNGAHGSVSTGGTNVLYLPEANYAGIDTFTYTITDADGDSSTATVTVNLGAENDAPVANGQSVSTNAPAAVTITLTATDVDSPSVTFAVGTAPVGGTLGPITPTGGFTATVLYTPNAGFSGSDPFTFTANDGAATSAPATVTVNVILVAVCGNGIIEAPETCDDNGIAPGDGCSATCTTETGWTCTGAPSACDEICGDTLVVGGEQCDDGPGPDTDGCTSQCITGRICTSAAITGGDAFSTDPETGTCYVSFTAEPTSFGGAYAACGTVGGHLVTITSAAEQARVHSIHLGTPWIGASEDGNDTDAVFDWVTTDAFGFTAFAPGEPDDDAAFGGNGECLAIVAADGGWGDTDCNFVGFTDGRICELPANLCGDGIIEAPEACDDGNRNAGDGCSATCTVESGAVCSGTAPTTCSKLVINEVDYDQPGADTVEFVEILNVGTAAANVANVRLVLMNGSASPGVEYFSDGTTGVANVGKRLSLAGAGVPSNLLPPGGMIVVGAAAVVTPASVFRVNVTVPSGGFIQNGAPDAVGLFDFTVAATPVALDVFSYEGSLATANITGVTGTFSFVEGTGHPTGDTAAASPAPVEGMSRIPNGRDTGANSTDFALRTVTPGAAN